MLKTLLQLRTELLHQNPWWEYRRDAYSLPDESEGEYFYIHTHGSAMIIPITDEGKIVIIRQFRYLAQRVSTEFIGGGVKPGKSYEESAYEELSEEAGLIAGEMTHIGGFNPMNGATDEICNIYVARSLKRTTMRPERSEEFEVIELDYTTLCHSIADGTIWDGMTLAAFALFRERRSVFFATNPE
ncbi:MAG: NUDIX hydrolase [bacterium]